MRRLANGIGTAWLAVSVGLIVVTIVTVLCQVAFRYVLAFPLAWTEEVSRLALVCAVYAGLPPAYLRGEHIVVDFFVGLLPKVIFVPYVILMKLICAVVIAYLALGAGLQAEATRHMTLIAIPSVSIAVVYALQAASLASFAVVILLTLGAPETYVSHEQEMDV
ncbi:TRAP transporter small permease subunit [Ancylobacter sp. MQZ15Z-1]|uniref:TRAP transporter small permease protein n=1 Tax=Ancylobacter mangrovi TaxID=2972472 RepID=A0A9X2P9P4_9HYPH|nr:TRAP transporter small permease subunit [Ancylobacter mangrovi]MCS0494621.1 TRAP transporter small permease subunit [Ancylobacter mangrovi]